MKLIKNILLTLICATLIAPQVFAKRKPLDKVEAVVNQEVILTSDLIRTQQQLKNSYKKKGKMFSADNDLQKQILNKLIDDRLQLQIATRMGLRISDAQLNQTLKKIAAEQGKTLAQYQQKLESKGENYQAFVDNVREELTINELRQIQIRRRINISEQEIQQMIKRIEEQGHKNTKFHFVHLLLKTNNNMSVKEQQMIEKQANDLLTQIKKGTDISSLAIKYSQGPKSLQGGDWGWLTIDEMPTLFANTFDEITTKKGDVIGLLRSKIGLHIIKVVDKKGSQNVITVEVNARHLLIKSNIVLNDTKAKKLLNNYRQEILDGSKTFAELARAHSQDPGSAIKGGNLGWADPKMYVPEFRDLALSLPIGEISQPFHTMHGWHILQIIDKRKSDTTKQATKQKAYGILFKQRFPAEVYAWVNEIRQEAYIKINNPNYIMKAQ